MYSYDDLFLFTKVVEVGSFIHTAKMLKISHTTISRRIKSLEDQLGVALLRVNTKNFELTQTGLRIYESLKNQADTVDDIIGDILDHQKEPQGTLNVILPTGIALDSITPHIPKFLLKYPKINLNLNYKNKELDLIKEGIDVAIINHLPKQQNQKIKNVFSTMALLYCTRAYADKYGIPNHPEELKNHLVTGYINDDYSISSSLSLTNIKTGEVVLTPMPRRIMTNNALQNIRLMETGEVIAALLDNIDLSHYRFEMVPVLPEYHLMSIKFYLLRHPHHNALKVQVFCKFLEDCLKH